jgi:2-methylisocitrate lyase-like PEP mutase family enzyme
MTAADPDPDVTARRMAAFAALHRAGSPLVLPNAWDQASAAALIAAGFPAVGTTSLGVAAAAGMPDGTGVTRGPTLALTRLLGRLPCLLTVDLEGGFSDDPAEVTTLAAEVAAAGAVGINLEDGRDNSRLAPVAGHCELIAAVKARVPGLFVNARTDTYWLGGSGARLEEALARAVAYRAAGADGVFVPGLNAEADIAAVVAAVEPR